MIKPKLYNSELLLLTFIKKSNANDMAQYIRSLNHYIESLEKKLDLYTDIDDETKPVEFEVEDEEENE